MTGKWQCTECSGVSLGFRHSHGFAAGFLFQCCVRQSAGALAQTACGTSKSLCFLTVFMNFYSHFAVPNHTKPALRTPRGVLLQLLCNCTKLLLDCYTCLSHTRDQCKPLQAAAIAATTACDGSHVLGTRSHKLKLCHRSMQPHHATSIDSRRMFACHTAQTTQAIQLLGGAEPLK